MRVMLQRLAEARQVHAPVRDLPASLRAALKRVGYGARDVAVVPQDSVVPNPYAGEGQRGFVLVVDLASGRARDLGGGWGGARPDDPQEIDFASKPVPIPPGGAVIIGTEGHPRTMATVYVHPDALAPLLPAAPAVTEREQMILRTVRSLISSARKEVFAHERVQAAEVDALVRRGLLSRSKSGAVSITTAGKNVAEGQEGTMRGLLDRLEAEAKASLDEDVRVDTTYYEYNHGGKPRGQGSWSFSFDKKDVPHDEMLVVHQSTYGDALKKAKAEAKKRKAAVIYPQS